MIRIWFASPDLHDFESGAPDDHIKLFVPGDIPGEVAMRDYTPRLFDAAKGRLAIDFAIHEAGPATRWALSAQKGDKIEIGGPRGSAIVTDDFDWYLLVGDETALPAIGRRLEELRPDVPVYVVAAIDTNADRVPLANRRSLTTIWVERQGQAGGDAQRLKAAIPWCGMKGGDGFVWIAAEADVARELRSFIIEERGHPKNWTKTSGYWSDGEAGAHRKVDD